MLEKPDIQDEKIIACLQVEYGLRVVQFAFLPLGGNLCTAVYRAFAEDGTPYFCKLRCSEFEEISVELPRLLIEQDTTQIIPPLPSKTGQLYGTLISSVPGYNGSQILVVFRSAQLMATNHKSELAEV